jgi:hypothetical protein
MPEPDKVDAEMINPEPVIPPPEDEGDNEVQTDAKNKDDASQDKIVVKSEHNGKTDTIVNAGYVHGNIHYYSTDNLSDPTDDYPESLLLGKRWHDNKEVRDFVQGLYQHRLLLVFSANTEAADAAVVSLLLCPEFSSITRRHLVRQKFDTVEAFWEDEKKKEGNKDGKPIKTTVNGVLSLENLISRKINQSRSTVVIAEPDSMPFVESIFTCRNTDIAQYCNQLKQKNLFLIVKIDGRNIIRFIHKNREKLLFPAWEVSGLQFLLYQNFDPETAAEYEVGLKSQQEKDLWGENMDSDELADAVGLSLSRGKRAFEREYYQRLKILEKPPAEIARLTEELRTLQPSEFLSRKNDPIAFHLAFLGAWFEKLTVRDFDILAFHFFSDPDKKMEVGKVSKRIKLDDGTVETREMPEYKSLLTLWRESPDESRLRAHLQRVLPTGSPHHYIEFSEFYLRDSVRDFFENIYPAFATESFNTLFKLTFFDLNADKNLLDNLARLNARMARQEPSAALDRLAGVSFNIQRAEQEGDAAAAERVEKAKDDINLRIQEIFTSILQKAEFQQHKNEYFRRIYLLVAEFWNDPDGQLKETVNQFLNLLLQNRLFEAAHFLVHRLWSAIDFKPLYWVQQLLERGDSDAKSNTFRLLLHATEQELARPLWEYIEEVATWLPSRDITSDNFSRSHEYALAFLFQLVFDTTEKTKGGKAQESSLLAPILTDEDSGLERWGKLLSWLFHPGLAPALFSIKPEKVYRTPGPVRAFVLDTWFWQLHGSEEPLTGKLEAVFYEMFVTLGRVTTLQEYRDTLGFLRKRSDEYRESRSERERYYVLRYFIQLFIDKSPFA